MDENQKQRAAKIDQAVLDQIGEHGLVSPNKALKFFLEQHSAPAQLAIEKKQIAELIKLLNSFRPGNHQAQMAFITQAGNHFQALFTQAEENRIALTRLHNQIQAQADIINAQTAALSMLDVTLNAFMQASAAREIALIAAFEEQRKRIQFDLAEYQEHLGKAITAIHGDGKTKTLH